MRSFASTRSAVEAHFELYERFVAGQGERVVSFHAPYLELAGDGDREPGGKRGDVEADALAREHTPRMELRDPLQEMASDEWLRGGLIGPLGRNSDGIMAWPGADVIVADGPFEPIGNSR